MEFGRASFFGVLLYCLIYVQVESSSIFQQNFEALHKEPDFGKTSNRNVKISTEWIEQKLDNFNASDNRKWKMRYMVNDQYFSDGGPILIFVGGEWTISPGSIVDSHLADIGKNTNGMLYYTEHRFYGESHPTKDMSVENLKYLSVDQALADLAYFIREMKRLTPGLKNSRVLLVGGSYSATMVTWFRKVYPELCNGAWSSSAPVLAKVDFLEYKEVVGRSIKDTSGQKCYDRIENGFKELEQMLSKNPKKLKEFFNLCDNFNVSNIFDVYTLFGELSDLFSGLVQTHSFGNIEQACNVILNGKTDVDGVVSWIRTKMDLSKCTNLDYKSLIAEMSKTKWNGGAMRQWLYQTCSEFGWYQTSKSCDQPFGTKFPVEYYVKFCSDVYGKKFSNVTIYKNIERINSIYGGMNPDVTNVYFTHGSLDPWHAMGIRKDLNAHSPAVVNKGYAHCKDLSSISSSDTQEMKNSKNKISQLAMQWLGFNKRTNKLIFM